MYAIAEFAGCQTLAALAKHNESNWKAARDAAKDDKDAIAAEYTAKARCCMM